MGVFATGRWTAATILLGIAAPSAPALADPPSAPQFGEVWRIVPGVQLPGNGRIAIADLDSDGLPEFVVAGRNYYQSSNVLLVVGNEGATQAIKQALILPDDPSINLVRVLASGAADGMHVYAVTADGTVRDFSGWPLAEQHHYATIAGVTAAAVGDVLGNGQPILLLGADDGLHAYDAGSGLPQWSYPTGAISDIALAQLDGDPALEIITSNGLVLDGLTQAVDWQYIDGFGAIATGHLLGASSTQFLGGYGSYFIAFGSQPWSPLWSGGSPYRTFDTIITADVDHDDRDVIVTATKQFGYVDVYDSTTQQMRFSLPGWDWRVSALAAGELYPDGGTDLVIAGTRFGYPETLRIVDLSSATQRWSYAPWSGIPSPVALGDVDGDGKDELVVAGSEPSGDYGTIAILDAGSGAVKWKAPDPNGSPSSAFYLSTARILLVPHAQDAAMDIVLAGSNTYDGRIIVVDGATHAVRLQVGSYASGPLGSRFLKDAAAVDFDGDGTLDYAVVTQASSTAASGVLLQVFSGVDGHQQWSSDPIGSGFAPVDGVFVTGPRSDPASELVAVLPWMLQAYDLQTQQPAWSLYVAADAALYVPNGMAGPEIVTFLGSGAVAVYDATTREYLRGFSLEPPLTALRAVDGDDHQLLAVSANRIALVDGATGDVLATSDFLGANLGLDNQLAVRARSGSTWDVAAGTDVAVFRYRLDLSDRIFTADFDGAANAARRAR